jgi:hypothetical protein
MWLSSTRTRPPAARRRFSIWGRFAAEPFQDAFSPTGRPPASRRQTHALQRAMACWRASDGLQSIRHLRIEFCLLQGFRAVAGQVDGKAGDALARGPPSPRESRCRRS